MPRLACIFTSAAFALLAIPPFPAYLTMLPSIAIVDPNRTVDEAHGEAQMPVGDLDNLKRGHHVYSRLPGPTCTSAAISRSP